ncbi:MAG: hypothetical protein U9Q96_01065 [Patescibacteria group bacterium]|nr:hypothetical protein [Patescibacteria group bacterium]
MKNKKNSPTNNREHHPLIRTIYLYLFALVGLALLISGSVRFVNMGLKAFVFTKAEQDMKMDYMRPLSPSMPIEKIEQAGDGAELSESERVQIRSWLEEYKRWEEKGEGIDYLTSRRHRDAATNTSLILVGLPLYLYHWLIIRRETKDRREV